MLWMLVMGLSLALQVIGMYFLVRRITSRLVKLTSEKTAKTFKQITVSIFSVSVLGSICNLAAVSANDGKMPVDVKVLEKMSGSASCDDESIFRFNGYRHTCSGEETRLFFLIDRLYYPSVTNAVLSIGDILMYIGMTASGFFIIVFMSSVSLRKIFTKRSP